MTISLIHVNPETGYAASICATGGVSVGGYVNHSWRELGACATQGLFTNPWYAEKAKKLLQQGLSAHQVIETLISEDDGHPQRQCMIMDMKGSSAFLNGSENIPYVGSIAFPHIAVAGNMLASEDVLEAFVCSFVELVCKNPLEVIHAGAVPEYKHDYELSLPEHLITALETALNVGGDKRGTYSASLRVESPSTAPIDVRVDWSDDQLIKDMRLVLSHVRSAGFSEFLSQLPKA
ncbi:Bll2871 protein [Vibrio astriarenae]|nr:Bll2871 protein [Vibrio sp. C7]